MFNLRTARASPFSGSNTGATGLGAATQPAPLIPRRRLSAGSCELALGTEGTQLHRGTAAGVRLYGRGHGAAAARIVIFVRLGVVVVARVIVLYLLGHLQLLHTLPFPQQGAAEASNIWAGLAANAASPAAVASAAGAPAAPIGAPRLPATLGAALAGAAPTLELLGAQAGAAHAGPTPTRPPSKRQSTQLRKTGELAEANPARRAKNSCSKSSTARSAACFPDPGSDLGGLTCKIEPILSCNQRTVV